MKRSKEMLKSALHPNDSVRFGHRGLDHLVSQVAAQGAYGAARYDPNCCTMTVRFASEPYKLPSRKRASGNPMEVWMPASQMERYAVNEWIGEMVARQSTTVPSSIRLEFRIAADLASAVQTAMMLQHFCGVSFGAEVDEFLDWVECELSADSAREGDQVVIVANLDLSGWSSWGILKQPLVGRPVMTSPREPERFMSY